MTRLPGRPQIPELSWDECRLLIQSVEDYAIFMLDPGGHVATWNRGAEKIKGYTPDEIRGRHFSVFYPPEDIAAGKPQLELKVALEVGHVEDEGWRLRKDGSLFWANVVITALHDATGTLRGFGKVTRDLTSRKATEEALRRSEERFRLLVEGVSDYAIYMLDPEGHVATWNQGAEKIKGYKASEIIGQSFCLFFGEEDVQAGKPTRELSIARSSGRFEEESWRIRKDGTKFWANIVLTAIRDDQGQLLGFAKVTRDLTSRLHAENTARALIRAEAAKAAAEASEVTLRASEERYRGLSVENARLYGAERQARERLALLARAGAVFSGASDYEETLQSIMQLALPMLGDFALFQVREAQAIRCIGVAHEDDEADRLLKCSDSLCNAVTSEPLFALADGQPGFHPHVDEAWLRDLSGSSEQLLLLRALKVCSIVIVPLQARGEVLGSLALCFGKSGRQHVKEDLRLAEEHARRAGVALVQVRLYGEAREAARKAALAAHQAEEASRVKDEFLATVSHELRTPLNAILGWSALLRGQSPDPRLVKGIDVIHRNAEAQAKIIEDILDVSRIITGKLRLDLKPADLVGVVRDALEVVGPSAAAKGLTLQFTPPVEPCLIVGDAERLQQVVWNLLSNAVKFSDAGGKIVVSLRREGSQLAVAVTDTGSGIDPEFLPFVFDRFKQADSSTTRRVGGLGLGLSIVRHIVELHGGLAFAASDGLGKGATLTIVLPVRAVLPRYREPDEAAPAATRLTTKGMGKTLEGVRVLVVDDEPDARDLLATVLQQAGCLVQTAGSAQEGLSMLARFGAQILVSDVGMPEEDGYSFMQRVRALEPAAGGNIPAIALTAYTRKEDKTRALSAGFTTHVGKPVSPDELLSVVSSLAALVRR